MLNIQLRSLRLGARLTASFSGLALRRCDRTAAYTSRDNSTVVVSERHFAVFDEDVVTIIYLARTEAEAWRCLFALHEAENARVAEGNRRNVSIRSFETYLRSSSPVPIETIVPATAAPGAALFEVRYATRINDAVDATEMTFFELRSGHDLLLGFEHLTDASEVLVALSQDDAAPMTEPVAKKLNDPGRRRAHGPNTRAKP